jgi:hypothetical protein
VILLAGHLLCALLTWAALVCDGLRRLSLRNFWRMLRANVRTFGATRIMLWWLLCLVAWPLVWIAWTTEWLGPRD